MPYIVKCFYLVNLCTSSDMLCLDVISVGKLSLCYRCFIFISMFCF